MHIYHWQTAGVNDWLPEVVAVLRQGGVALIPTETAYGLAAAIVKPSLGRGIKSPLASPLEKGGDPLPNPPPSKGGGNTLSLENSGVQKVYALKGRPVGKPLSLLVGSLAIAERYVEFSQLARELAEQHWPGPLTLVLPVTEFGRQALAPECVSERGEVALRVSPHPFLVELFRLLDAPITATSANLAGGGECYSPVDALAQLTTPFPTSPLRKGGGAVKTALDVIVDAGELKRVRPSTIARVVGDRIEVLREGPIVL